jgi:DNA-binding MarR family transcriptional regulator
VTVADGGRAALAVQVLRFRRRLVERSPVHETVNRVFSEALELDKRFNEQLGITALRPEARMLITLSRTGPLSIKQAISLSGLSYRGFYLILNKMIDQGFVRIDKDTHDGRVRKLVLVKSIE